MASFEDIVMPDLSLLIGQNWSKWQSAITLQDLPNGKKLCSNKRDKEVARLKRNDLELFGSCPAKDEFYVVVCDHCHLPFKPQAFRYHMEKHHKSNVNIKNDVRKDIKSKSTSTTKWDKFKLDMQTNSSKSLSSSRDNISRTNHIENFKPALNQLHSVVDKPPSLFNACIEKVSIKSSKKSHKTKHNISTVTSSSDTRTPIKKLTIPPNQSSGEGTKEHETFNKLKATQTFSSFQQGTRGELSNSISSTSLHRARKHNHNPQLEIVKSADRLNMKEQANDKSGNSLQISLNHKLKRVKSDSQKVDVYDPNKHCGVLVNDHQVPCVRSLACKIHPRSLKRKVSGRRKPFDELLSDQTVAKRRLTEVEPSNTQRHSTPDAKNDKANVSSSLNNKTLLKKKTNSMKSSLKKFQLFSRPQPSVIVDLWRNNSLEISNNNNNNDDQSQAFKSSHPSPLSVCNFGARRLSSNFSSFNTSMNFQSRTLQRSFRSISKRDSRPSSGTSSHVMKAIPTVSDSTLNVIKRAKRDRQVKKQKLYNLTDRETKLYEGKYPVSYANSHSIHSLSFGRILKNQFLARSRSISKDLTDRVAVTEDPSSTFKTPSLQSCRRSLSLDHRRNNAAAQLSFAQRSVSCSESINAANTNTFNKQTRNRITYPGNMNSTEVSGTFHRNVVLNGRKTGKKTIFNLSSLTNSPSPSNGFPSHISSNHLPQSLTLSGHIGALQSHTVNNYTSSKAQNHVNKLDEPPKDLDNIHLSAFEVGDHSSNSLQDLLSSASNFSSASLKNESHNFPSSAEARSSLNNKSSLALSSEPFPVKSDSYVTDLFSLFHSDS